MKKKNCFLLYGVLLCVCLYVCESVFRAAKRETRKANDEKNINNNDNDLFYLPLSQQSLLTFSTRCEKI